MTRYADPRQLGDPVFENISHDPRRSFYWHCHGFPSPLAKWNYHPEYELHLIRHSHGHYIVGDHTDRFGPGNLVLVGPNLPHAWFSDLTDADQIIEDRDLVVQFRGEWLASLTRLCPELRRLDTLMTASARGVVFTGTEAADGARQLESMTRQNEITRVANLIDLLGRLAYNDYRPLASPRYRLRQGDVRIEQMDAILQYIHRNFDRPLTMTEIAHWQGMTPSTFSRFFKQTTGDTFVAFVRRLRIDHACRLLLDEHHAIADICFWVGYGNLSNFNRHFRRQTGMTPRDYRRSAKTPSTDYRIGHIEPQASASNRGSSNSSDASLDSRRARG